MTINLMDSTEYLGNFVLTNGKLDKYLFSGGYINSLPTGKYKLIDNRFVKIK